MHELRQVYPVIKLLKVVELARSTFYYWDQKRCAGVDKYAQVKDSIRGIYDRHKGRYGYRRIAKELELQGQRFDCKTILKLMGEMGLSSLQRKKRGYSSYAGAPGKVASNILDRKFKATKPNQKWTTDVTEFKVGNEKLYLSPVLDLHHGEIVAFELGRRPTLDLVLNSLRKAASILSEDDRPLMHSDQGWQYRMPAYQHLLQRHGMVQSMSRKGNCHDNATMESFFGILKSELFHLNEFEDADALERGIIEYITYYNHERGRPKLNGLSPVQHRAQLMATLN